MKEVLKEFLKVLLFSIGLIIFSVLAIFCTARYLENRNLLNCVCGCSKYRLIINKYRDYDKWGIKGKYFHVDISCPKCGVKVKATNVHDFFILNDAKVYWNETIEKEKNNIVTK